MKSVRAIIAIAVFVGSTLVPAFAQQVSGPATVVNDADFNADASSDLVPDGNFVLVGYMPGGGARWLFPIWDRKRGGIKHMLAEGSLEHPVKRKVWVKSESQFFQNATRDDGNLWIANTYLAKDGVLGIVHAEAVHGTGRPGYTGRTRIGLAWSNNAGETFRYLGEIISGYQDPLPHNVQGGAYVVKDGYMYIYYHDVNGISVARAPLEEVLLAARAGRVTQWSKYAGERLGFSSPGLGGMAAPIGVKGASHNDAACSVYTKKCYLVLTTMTWGGAKSTITLYESSDAVTWSPIKTLGQEPSTSDKVRGYQYATIVNADGSDNSSVGERFYVYSAKNHLDKDRAFYRWTVDLK